MSTVFFSLNRPFAVDSVGSSFSTTFPDPVMSAFAIWVEFSSSLALVSTTVEAFGFSVFGATVTGLLDFTEPSLLATVISFAADAAVDFGFSVTTTVVLWCSAWLSLLATD